MRKLFVVLGLLFLCSFFSFAQYVTGSDLHTQWLAYNRIDSKGGITASLPDTLIAGRYIGYITASLDTAQMFGFTLKTKANISIGQLAAIVGKYLDSHPEEWANGANTIVLSALRDAFGWESLSGQ